MQLQLTEGTERGERGASDGKAVIAELASLSASWPSRSRRAPEFSSKPVCTDRTCIRGETSRLSLIEYVFRASGAPGAHDICFSSSGPERLGSLPLAAWACGSFDGLVRKMLQGQSLDLANLPPQHPGFLAMLSQASTTRSLLRKCEIWDFMVSR